MANPQGKVAQIRQDAAQGSAASATPVNAVNTNPGAQTATTMPNTNPGQTPTATPMQGSAGGASNAGAADALEKSWTAAATGSSSSATAAEPSGYYDDRGKYRTTIYGADGKSYSGYIYNGATYYDDGTRIGVGDSVVGADGQRHTMTADKTNVNPNLSNAKSPEFQDWLYSENAGKSAFAIKNDFEGFLPQYRTDKYGQDVSNGAVTVWPDGSVMVSDGFQNVIGRFDSAGTWHPASEGVSEEAASSKSWEDVARKALEEAGHKFTGNGMEFGQKQYTQSVGPTSGGMSNDQIQSPNKSSVSYTYTYTNGNRVGTPGPDAPVGGVPNYGTGAAPAQSTGIDIQPYLDALMNGQSTGSAPTPSGIDIQPLLDQLMSGQGNTGDIQAYLDQIKAQNPNDAAAIDAYVAAALNSKRPDIPQAPDLKPLLDEWRTNEEARQQSMIDYNVNQGVTNLQRAEEDAQQGFRTAQEQISADEMRSRDNQALYAEARGDKGGIGAAQYDSIANTAAINRQNVRDSQIKLSTDTARQIEDLRNQGEFQKADAVLQVSQQYLQNLMSLEQWAANYGLSAAQFEEAIREWEQNFKLNVANLTGEINGVQTLAARNADRDFAMNLMNYDLNRQNADRDYAMNLMNYDLNRTNADRNYELNRQNSDRDFAMNLMNYDLNRTNADRNFTLNEAGLTGYYNGRATMDKINADRNFGLNEANVTGYYNGKPTMAKTNADRNYELEKTNADRNFRLNEANITGTYNGQPTYAATKQNTSNLSSIGMSMLQSGIMPSSDMLQAMGISDADAQAYLMGLQAQNESKKGGTYYYTPPVDTDDTNKLTRTWQTSSQAVKDVVVNAANAAATGLTSYADALESYAREAYGKGALSKEDIEYIKSLINN